MIQPRVCRAPADLGGTTADVPRVGFIEPGHWGGGIFAAGFSIAHLDSVVSDWIVLTGYNKFMLQVNFLGTGHVGVAWEFFSRTSGAVIGVEANLFNLTTPGDRWLGFGAGCAVGTDQVWDICRLKLSETNPAGSPMATFPANAVSMYCTTL